MTPPQHEEHVGWSDSSARAVLQLMVESVAQTVGFEMATLSVVLGDTLVTMAYTGPEHLRDFFEADDPVSVIEPVLAHPRIESWGRCRFLAAEHYEGGQAALDGHWFAVSEPGEGTDAWHPDDIVLGLFHDEGRLVGMLSVDRPVNGRRPDAAQRDLLERYVAQAERAVITAFEREALVQQVAHAETARKLVRSAAMPAQASLDAVLHHTHQPLLDGFAASGTWIHAWDGGRGFARGRDGREITLPDEAIGLARQLAHVLWEHQEVLVLAEDVEPTGSVAAVAGELVELARQGVKDLGYVAVRRVLAVPLGAGTECLGFLAISRADTDPPWSAVEIGSALEIGHDLGAALLTARALENERALVRELQALDDHRSQLISTLSHELRTPLTVISSNLELLGDLGLDGDAARFQAAMGRGTGRMQKVVDDLLLLARVSDPRHPLQRVPVDLRALLDEVVGFVGATADAKGLDVRVRAAGGDATVLGDADELDRLFGNLVSNAVKYTGPGGRVRLDLAARDDHVEVAVRDTGLGISEEDRIGLFRAFFRSTNPDALREHGTGLGLTIVASIVERHSGTVAVESRLGEGTCFTVVLPRA